jgi:hypothetical protein
MIVHKGAETGTRMKVLMFHPAVSWDAVPHQQAPYGFDTCILSRRGVSHQPLPRAGDTEFKLEDGCAHSVTGHQQHGRLPRLKGLPGLVPPPPTPAATALRQ